MISIRSHQVYLAAIILILCWTAHGYIKFSNLKCVSHDKAFSDFRVCSLKVISRGVISLNVHCELYQLPVREVGINFNVQRKSNGYRPFMHNITSNFCAVMKSSASDPFLAMLLKTVSTSSNINHTCPYNHDIIISNYTMSEDIFQMLLLPKGEYLATLGVSAYNIWRANVMIYLTAA